MDDLGKAKSDFRVFSATAENQCLYLVNTISQEGKLGQLPGQISYLVCRCTTLSTRSLLFLVEVKGHSGVNFENSQKASPLTNSNGSS